MKYPNFNVVVVNEWDSQMLDDSIDNLISIMEEKINEIRFTLLRIQNEKVVNELIESIKPKALDLFVDFDGADNEKIEHLNNLKGELLKLLSLYEKQCVHKNQIKSI